MKFKKGNIVRTVDFDSIEFKEEIMEKYVGEEAIIIEVDKTPYYPYPYAIVFFSKSLQLEAMDEGIDWWREEDLELI